MAVDAPARIVVIGAGPVGLEAALYARYLGYEVLLFEQAMICGSFLQQGEEVLPQTAGENRTSLGLGALRAQQEEFPAFDPAAQETVRELAESYLLPLAASDLLVDCLRVGQTVLRVSRTDFPDEDVADEPDADLVTDASTEDDEFEELVYAPFELIVRLPDGTEVAHLAEVVIDATGNSNSTPISFVELRIEPEGAGDTPVQADFQTNEPNFYRLGSKTSVTGEAFTLAAGHAQIRRLFAIIGGRETLDLYATFKLE